MAPLIERSPWDSSVRCHQPQPWPQSPALHFQCPREGGRASRALRGGSRDVTCTEVCPRSSPRTRQTAQSTWQVFVPFHLEPPRPVCRRADEKQYPPLSAPRAGQALQHSQLSIKLRLEAHGWKGWKGRQEASNPNQANNFAGVSNLRESENKAIQVRHWSGKGGGKSHIKSIFLDGREENGAGGISTGALAGSYRTAPSKGDRPLSPPKLHKDKLTTTFPTREVLTEDAEEPSTTSEKK